MKEGARKQLTAQRLEFHGDRARSSELKQAQHAVIRAPRLPDDDAPLSIEERGVPGLIDKVTRAGWRLGSWLQSHPPRERALRDLAPNLLKTPRAATLNPSFLTIRAARSAARYRNGSPCASIASSAATRLRFRLALISAICARASPSRARSRLACFRSALRSRFNFPTPRPAAFRRAVSSARISRIARSGRSASPGCRAASSATNRPCRFRSCPCCLESARTR